MDKKKAALGLTGLLALGLIVGVVVYVKRRMDDKSLSKDTQESETEAHGSESHSEATKKLLSTTAPYLSLLEDGEVKLKDLKELEPEASRNLEN